MFSFLKVRIKKNADDFVTALSTLTENLLFQLDNILTVDEIQGGCKWSVMRHGLL